MTISELIKTLAGYAADMRVVVNGYEEGYDDLEERLECVREIRLNTDIKWWERHHREVENTRTECSAIVNALMLNRPMKLALCWNNI